ncbi:MAG TPA: LysM peptidoglycan-binding domain-containing protein [Jatrophihabitantaceae bacterium]|jgi:hypothetical protein
MSVATEFHPDVWVPARARPERDATVLPFRTRQAGGDPAPLGGAAPAGSRSRTGEVSFRLTRRGYAVVGLLAATLVAGLLWLAHASVPASPRAPDVGAVTVRDGDTLWSIASRIAPQRDPRLVVAELEDVNHLSSPTVAPGQILRTR